MRRATVITDQARPATHHPRSNDPVRQHDIPLALTYDDVLLVPQRSGIVSRRDVDPSGRLTPGIRLANPIVSANMDTVTEWRMARAMARAGGIGIIHRFLSIEQQTEHVRRVKRSESFVIDSPWTTRMQESIGNVVKTFAKLGVNGLPVIDDSGALLGLITHRDLLAAEPTGVVADVMTPRADLAVGAPDESLERARKVMVARRVEKLPLVDDRDVLVGLITMKDIEHLDRFPDATKDARGRLRVGAAIGVRGDYLERARRCAEAGADVLCLDIAHGHAEHSLVAVERLRREVDIELIAGNVATAAGARDLISAGAHAIKVGVGPGSVCTTRLVAGVGVPQLSAVFDCAEACHDAGVPLCADGGIRMPADVAKAVAAGAETVMVGNMLAGATESPGTLLERGGRTLKVHRGMASGGAMRSRPDAPPIVGDEPWPQLKHLELGDKSDFGQTVPEGVEAAVPFRGDAAGVVAELIGGLRSAMSYSNSPTQSLLHERAMFVRVTAAGQIESRPHDVEV